MNRVKRTRGPAAEPGSLSVPTRIALAFFSIAAICTAIPGGCPSPDTSTAGVNVDAGFGNEEPDGNSDGGVNGLDGDGGAGAPSPLNVSLAAFAGAPAIVALESSAGPVEFVIEEYPVHGTLGRIAQHDGRIATIEYTANLDYQGMDGFSFRASSAAGSGVARASITVYPEIQFTVSPTEGSRDLIVVGEAVPAHAGNALPEATYIWTFGDTTMQGSLETHREASHAFRSGGAHLVRLAVLFAGIEQPAYCRTVASLESAATVAVNPMISGVVRDASGIAINDLDLVSNDGRSATTEADGSYQLEVPFGWSGVLEPNLASVFSPARREFNGLVGDSSANDFSAGLIGAPDAPRANDQQLAGLEDTTVDVVLSAAGGSETIDFSLVRLPLHGSLGPLTRIEAGSVRVPYTPAANFSGMDSFTFIARNSRGQSSIALVNITVSPVNDPPTFSVPADPQTTFVGWPLSIELLNLSAGPGEAGQTLSVTAESSNQAVIPNSSLSFGGARLVITPLSSGGPVTISVTVRDDGGTASGGSDSRINSFIVNVQDGVGTLVSGRVSLAATVGYRRPLGPVGLSFTGSGGSAGTNFSAYTDLGGYFNQPVPAGWQGTIAALDPANTILTPASRILVDVQSPRPNQDFDCWKPPFGVPMPPFGIRESHTMYAGRTYDFGSGPISYPDAGNGPYTHYVDNTHPSATDSGNPYGTPATPRLTIPTNLSAGSVVEVHGGTAGNEYYRTHGSSWVGYTVNGTESAPIFIRGVGARPIISRSGGNIQLRMTGQYYVFEHFDFVWAAPAQYAAANHHVSVRDCEFRGTPPAPGGSAITPSQADYVVFFNNHIHDNGDPNYFDENDIHGVQVGQGATNIWIVDNHIHHCGGDSVQVNSTSSPPESDWARFVYIAGNDMHSNGENAVDLKQCKDVIVSQNDAHNFAPSNFAHSGSDGAIFVVHYDPKEIWFLFNQIHDGMHGLRNNGSIESYVVGNVFYDIRHDPASSYNPDSTWSGGHGVLSWATGELQVVNNTFYQVDSGLGYPGGGSEKSVVASNNIFAELNEPAHHVSVVVSSIAADSTLEYSLFHGAGAARIKWGSEGTVYNLPQFRSAYPDKGVGCITGDPLFANVAALDFRPLASSPAVRAGTRSAVYDLYQQMYGLSITVDANGTARPASHWTIGAYEHAP